jgi:hypothetical protein
MVTGSIWLALVLYAHPAWCVDDCDSIQKYITEHYDIQQESDFRRHCLDLMNKSYEQLESESKQQGKKGSLALKILSFGLAGGASKQQAEAKWKAARGQLSTLSVNDVSSFQSFYMQADIVNSVVVNAWVECKRLRLPGVYGSLTVLDSQHAQLNLSYAHAKGTNDNAFVRSINDGVNCRFVKNADQPSEMELHSIPPLSEADVTYTIRKLDSGKPAAVVVNTDKGSFKAVF